MYSFGRYFLCYSGLFQLPAIPAGHCTISSLPTGIEPLPPPQTNELNYAVSNRFHEAEFSAALKRTNKDYEAYFRLPYFVCLSHT
jgi:hypothetical protein